MSIKAKIEAIIYAAEEPVGLDQIAVVLKEAGLLEELLRPPSNALGADVAGAPDAAEASDESAAPGEASAEQKVAHDPKETAKAEKAAIKARLLAVMDELIADFAANDRGMEIRQVAGGYRMATKPEHHDVVRSFAKSLKPPMRLSLQALETLAVVAYKQPVTAPEISEIRGVDSSGVLATLIDRKFITTAGRKAVIGRPILYKTTKEFLLRFGLKDIGELPSMEEFEKMTQDVAQDELFDHSPVPDATGIPDEPILSERAAENANLESPVAAEIAAEPDSIPEIEPDIFNNEA